MSIGKLRHSIQILRRREVMVPNAATSVTFSPIYHCYAEIKPVSGYVSFDTKQINETITHKIRIRYHKHVTTENWISFNQILFRIRFVENVLERGRWLELLCEQSKTVLPLFETGISGTEDPL